MILYAYALYDLKVGAFHTPFFMPHDALAVRAVVDLAGDNTTHVGRHPHDFQLTRVGAYNDQTGQFEAVTQEILGTAFNLAERERRSQPSML